MRIIRNGNGFGLVSVDKAERKQMLARLRVENRRLMRSCLLDATKLNERGDFQLEPDGVAAVAVALFEKLALKVGWVLWEAETVKTFNEKEAAKVAASGPASGKVET